jgi:hypothetical protein
MALTPDQAIELARTLWPRDAPGAAAEPATAWSVRRLDRPDTSYYLVVLGTAPRAAHVAIIDQATGRIGSSAALPNGRSPVALSAEGARGLAGAGRSDDAELVWMPSQASRSPLYPIWRVRASGAWRYVSQQGQVFDALVTTGPGGGRA